MMKLFLFTIIISFCYGQNEIHANQFLIPSKEIQNTYTLGFRKSLVRDELSGDFNYNCTHGVFDWASMGHSKCESKNQSPINILSSMVQTESIDSSDVIHINYQINDWKLSNEYLLNATIREESVDYKKVMRSSLLIAEKGEEFEKRIEYFLKDIVFHSPAEHLIDGVRFALEIQLNHVSADGELLSVSVFGMKSPINNTSPSLLPLSTSIDHLLNSLDDSFNTTFENFNPTALLPKKEGFWMYTGSKTVPPCEETVKWIIMQHPINVTGDFIENIKKAIDMRYFGGNARNVQEKTSDFEVKVYSNTRGSEFLSSNPSITSFNINSAEKSKYWNVVDIARYWKIFSETKFLSLEEMEDQNTNLKIILKGRSIEAFQFFFDENNGPIAETVEKTIYSPVYNLIQKCAANYTWEHRFQSAFAVAEAKAPRVEQFPPPKVAPGAHLLNDLLLSPTRISVSAAQIHRSVEQSVYGDPELIRMSPRSISIEENHHKK